MSHLSTLALHRYVLGELPDDEAASASDHLSSCAKCLERVAAAEAENEAIASEPLPAFLADVATEPQAAPDAAANPSQWALFLRRVGMPAVSLLAAAILLVVALPTLQQPDGPSTRTRGALPDLEVWLQAPDGHRPLMVGEALSDGDQVVLFYHPQDARHVALAGRDHTGAVEVYRLLQPAKEGLQPAPFALTLDEAPGVQEFFVVADVRAAPDAIAAIEAMDDRVTRVVVPKEPVPSRVP